MKLAFFKADKGNFWDKLINWWTGKYGYSHCELVFSDGRSFSADSRSNKVRFSYIDIDNTNIWNVIDIEMHPDKEEEIRLEAIKHLGKRYDWVGILLHQFLPFGIQSNGKWWCSEICMYLLGIKNYRINPNQAAKLYKIHKA